jgi:hypothetical protein
MNSTNTPPPASPQEAENLARKAVGEYLTACNMYGYQPAALADYLQTLSTLAGLIMAKAEGSRAAVRRLQAGAEFVSSAMPLTPDGPTHWPSYDPTTPTKFELQLDPSPPRPAAAPSVLSAPPNPEAAAAQEPKGKLLVVGDLFARVARGG